MKKTVTLTAEVVCTDELSATDQRVRAAAINSARKAYAPYSRFRVGAAALLEDGTVITGNNQENVAYPSGMCAERVALFAAGSTCPETPVRALAIAAIQDGEIQPSVAPCGSCRQVMAETERRYGQPFRVLMCGRDETVIAPSARDLLPFCFEK